MALSVRMQMSGAPAKISGLGLISRAIARGVIGLVAWTGSACAAQASAKVSPEAVAAFSPVPVVVRSFEAIHLGLAYAASHSGTRIFVGSGGSMLPLYRDQTVVVTQRISMADLRAGMTVAYVGESGRPVAHVLVKKTFGGWVAMGFGNKASDSALVTRDNLIGVVVKAFEPTNSPLVALLDEARMRDSVAAMP